MIGEQEDPTILRDRPSSWRPGELLSSGRWRQGALEVKEREEDVESQEPSFDGAQFAEAVPAAMEPTEDPEETGQPVVEITDDGAVAADERKPLTLNHTGAPFFLI